MTPKTDPGPESRPDFGATGTGFWMDATDPAIFAVHVLKGGKRRRKKAAHITSGLEGAATVVLAGPRRSTYAIMKHNYIYIYIYVYIYIYMPTHFHNGSSRQTKAQDIP